MTDLTRQEEREMIEKAKAGDPEANYRMSFWALEQAAAEPGEERWNQLAAKCLVKAAQAGYEPAKKHMEQLLRAMESEEAIPAEAEKSSEPGSAWEMPSEVSAEPVAAEPARRETACSTGERAPGKLAALGAGVAQGGKNLLQKGREFAAGLKDGSFGEKVAEWSPEKWKKIQLMCIIACAVLAFLIVLMLVTGKGTREEAEEIAVPTPSLADQAEVTPSPTPVPYPDEATRAVIAEAELDIYPDEGDYVSAATTAVLEVNSGLNLRSGPASSYGQIVLMEAKAEVEIYAVKNGWALVLYNGDTWGWCSDDYLALQ